MRRIRYEVLPTAKADRKADPSLQAWTVTRQGERLASFPTQAKAVTFATTTARCAWRSCGQLGQVRIKRPDGTIRDERTYGADPRTSKG